MTTPYYSAKTGTQVDAAVTRVLTQLNSASEIRAAAELGDSATKDVGTAAGEVAAGDDTRFTDARTPTDASVTDAKIATTLSPSKITGTAVVTADSRLSDARTPTAHSTSHKNGGSDEIAVATAAANAIPKAGAGGKLGSDWLTGVLASSDLTNDAALEKVASKAVANGYASLDSGGKVPVGQLPAAVIGASQYQGTWNANTNTPALATGVGTTGYWYKVSVAGTTSIDGTAEWNVGDMIIFDGTAWDKIDNTEEDATSLINGRMRLTRDLGNSAASPQVVGLKGLDLPANTAGAFLKLNAGGTAWEEVAYGVGANTVCQGNDARLSDSRAPSGAAGGDLSGTYPNPGVAKINGVAFTVTATDKNLLVANGTAWASVAVTGDITLSNAGVVAVTKINGVALGSTTATDKNILIANGTSWVTQALSGDVTIGNTGVATLAAGANSLGPDFAVLTDAATVTWATAGARVNAAKVTITATRILSITGAVAGASGILKVTQGGAGSFGLTLPSGSKVANAGAGGVTLSTPAGSIDILSWYYDGTNYFWTISLNFT